MFRFRKQRNDFSLMSRVTDHQTTAFEVATFPRTRYQGSKRRFVGSIIEQLNGLDFTTVLDAFGGTGAVSHALKCIGKHVTHNDILAFNQTIGLALIENDDVRLSDEDVAAIGVRRSGVAYEDFIERTFDGIYFTQEENRWLDVAVRNVRRVSCPYRQAMAWFALFQAAMAKRPYNLFHRKNLYMRTAEVTRSFGNKACWDRSFPDHVAKFAREANDAVIQGHGTCQAICHDALAIEPGFDLVYVDTPYINRNGVGVDYRDFYHFLEGMIRYDEWPSLIDRKAKHLRLLRTPDPWSDADQCDQMFRRLFEHFGKSTLVVSYRSDGIPTVERLVSMMQQVKPHVRLIELERSQYVLSTRRETHEVLIVGAE